MGYRDEGEAALQKVQNLQQQLIERHEEVHALQDGLSRANAEIERLKGQPIEVRLKGRAVSKTNQALFRASLALAVVGLVPLFMAIYKSETLGMKVAALVVPLWGAALGAFVTRFAATNKCVVATLIGAAGCFVTLELFFATIWKSL